MLKTSTIFKFPGGPEATLSQVGGKGLSLIKSSESGMPVPPGFVLSVHFFTPWLEQLKTSPEWTAFSQATAEQMQATCSALKSASAGFTFTNEQREAIDEFLEDFEADALFAVRSSSPEEDLEGASFAGGYETILGVNKTSIESAVRRAFASCLDFRVAAYKREHGFDVSSPKIAVVVQRQIASKVAGVGFSINPLTNNFDEAVINANFGLGETVVGGLATPDTFTVDRNARTVSNKQLGGKETSIWLDDSGGTTEKPAVQKNDFCLTDQQILELSDLIAKVEGIYGKPIDTEWALAENQFYLLQARPITAYMPLASNMVTSPCERKSLFLDATIVVQGLYKPMSPMGTSVIARVLTAASEHVLGQSILGDPHKSVATVQNGRIYINLSVMMAMFGRDKLAQVVEQMDPTSSQALCELDEHAYKAEKGAFSHPPFHLLMQLPEPILRLLESNLLPEHAHKSVARAIANFMVETREHAQNDKSVMDVANDVIPAGFKFIFRHSVPLFAASRAALEQMKSIVGDINQPAWTKIQRALPNNVTTEMGLALYHLALLEPGSAAYREGWKLFVDLYGHRGPEEFDIASPRYRDQAQLLHDQIETLRKSANTTDNPQARFEQAQIERHEAYEELCEQIQKQHGWVQLKRFQAMYRVF